MRRFALALAVLLAAPAQADMFQDAGNAKLPEATVNLGVQYTVKPGGNIQAGLTQVAAAGGGTVRVTPGTYDLSSELLIGSNTHLLCDKGAALHRAGTGSASHIQNQNRGNAAKLDHDMTIEGCTFTWALPFSADGAAHAVQLWQFRRATIRNNTFTSGGDATALLGGDTSVVEGNSYGTIVAGNTHGNTTVDGLPCTTSCGVYVGSTIASGQGGIPYASYVTAINSETSVTMSAAAALTTAAARIGLNVGLAGCWDHWDAFANAMVSNNKCVVGRSGVTMTGSSTTPSSSDSNNGTVQGNVFNVVGVGTANWGIVFDGDGLPGSGMRNGTITGNVIRGDNATNFTCFMMKNDTRNIVISGNVCADAGPQSMGVRWGPSDPPLPSNISIFNNNFHNIGVSGEVAVMQLNGDNVTAVGNVVSGTNAYPSLIWADKANPVLIGNRGATGTGIRIETTGATNPVVVDTVAGTGQVFYPGVAVPSMPTSCTGAMAGTLRNNAGVVNICP